LHPADRARNWKLQTTLRGRTRDNLPNPKQDHDGDLDDLSFARMHPSSPWRRRPFWFNDSDGTQELVEFAWHPTRRHWSASA
jgi:hypothetical protein